MERNTLIEHVEQEVSGKDVQTLKKTCEKLHRQCRKEEKGSSKYSQVLPKWLLTIVVKAGRKKYFLFPADLRGR
jgi:hypothetical protein